MKRLIYIFTFIATVCQAQFTQLGNKLVGTGSSGAAWQGIAVDMSADGKTAIVGGYLDNSGVGAAWIYTFNGSGFVQLGSKLVGSNYVGASNQGWSVGISADGKRAVVGAIHDNSIGATWVYTFNGTNFVQAAKLVGSGATTNGSQGSSVAISGDGNTIVVGGSYNDGSVGATWIFTFNGSNFVQLGSKLSGFDHVGNANQGASVDISSNGKIVIVGGRWDNTNVGAAWIYTFNGTSFIQAGNKLVGSGNIGESWQGNSVCISGDGKTAVIGGTSDDSNTGAIWVYTFNGSNYVQAGNKLKGTDEVGAAGFGFSSISNDGTKIVIGGGADNSGIGAIWVYTFNGTGYVQAGNKLTGTGSTGNAQLGYLTQISGDGNTMISGGIYDNSNIGAAWVFVNTTTSCNVDLQSGLLAEYNFEGNVYDYSGNGYNGTVTGGSYTNDRFGTPNKALYLNGSNSGIDFAKHLKFASEKSSLTVSLWAKYNFTTTGGIKLILNGFNGNEAGFLLMVNAYNPGDIAFGMGDKTLVESSNFSSSIYITTTNTAVHDNTWHHLLVRVDSISNLVTIFVDGNKTNIAKILNAGGTIIGQDINYSGLNNISLNSDGHISYSVGKLVDNLFSYSGGYFNGSIDDIKVYRRALSDCEINALYTECNNDLQNGLLAYYKFNGKANDETGNGNNSTSYNLSFAAKDKDGVFPSAISFDGNNLLPVNNTLGNFGTGDFSFSFWFNAASIKTMNRFISKRLSPEWDNYFSFEIYNGKLVSELSETLTKYYEIAGNTTINANNWYHVVFSRKNNELFIYLNGQQEITSINDGAFQSININNNYDFLFGNAYQGTGVPFANQGFQGSLDEIYVYNRALTDCEITALYNGNITITGLGLVASYPFCGNANETTTNNLNGTISGSVTLQPDRFNNTNSSYKFGGASSDIIKVENKFDALTLNQFSVSFWIKRSRTNIKEDLFVAASSGGWGVYLSNTAEGHNNQLGFTQIDWGGRYSSYTIDDLNWHHCAVVSSNSQTTFYLDGVNKGTQSYARTFIGSNIYSFGDRFGSFSDPFNGQLDDFKIFNTTLTDAQISGLYAENAPCITNLVASYPFCGNANDVSGNGNNGTISGAILTTDRFGNANSTYSFNDNIPTYLKIPLTERNTFSISFWMKSNIPSTDLLNNSWFEGKSLVSAEATNCVRDFGTAIIPGGQVQFGIGAIGDCISAGINSLSSVNDNVWHHIVATRNSSNGEIQLYIDNVLEATGIRHTQILDAPSFIGVGGNEGRILAGSTDKARFYNGLIDDIMIYNSVLTTFEIQNLYTAQPSCAPNIVPIASYPFCGNANDVSGNANNLSTTGFADDTDPVLTTDRFGNPNSAYHFDVNTKWFTTSISGLNASSMSVSLWFKADNVSIGAHYPTLFDFYDNAKFNTVEGSFGAGHAIKPYHPGASQNVNSTINVHESGYQTNLFSPDNSGQAGTWYHIVITYDINTNVYQIYQNGTLSGSTIAAYDPLLMTNLMIGSYHYYIYNTLEDFTTTGLANYMTGSIDDIKIYNKVISSGEIQALYNETNACCTAISNVSISGPSYLTNCNPSIYAVTGSGGRLYTWSTTSGFITDASNQNTSVYWINPGIYPLQVTVTNGCSETTAVMNVTVASTISVTSSITKPVIGRNNNNLIVSNTVTGIDYQWLYNGSNEIGQSNANHTNNLLEGRYQVMASSLAECAFSVSDSRNILPITQVVTITIYDIHCVTQIEEFKNSAIEIYPNPGTGIFHLSATNVNVGKIEIFNGQGQVIYNKLFENYIDLTSQPAGIYLLRIFDTSESFIKTTNIIIE